MTIKIYSMPMEIKTMEKNEAGEREGSAEWGRRL